MQEIQFDYFRGMEAEQYSFYRVPKVLFTAECFKSLSCEAKVLYGLMLDRMSLSIKNRWFDEEDRVYIIFTVEEIAELLNCGTQKAVKLMKELDDNQGIGLIEKKCLGLGKPNVIYVKNFILKEKCSPEQRGKAPENLGNTQNSENHNSRIVKTTNQELPESQFKNDENHTSRIVEITTQEVPNSQSNNTDINNTDFNETDFNEIDSIQSYLSPSAGEVRPVGEDVIERMETYRALIQEKDKISKSKNTAENRKENPGAEERRDGIMRVRFEEDEMFVMAMFKKENRLATMQEIRRILPFIKEDGEMLTLVNHTLEKMEQLTNQEFAAIDLEDYQQDTGEEP